MAKKKKPKITYQTRVPKTCGNRYVSHRLKNGTPVYSICNKNPNHWFGGCKAAK